MKTKLLNTEGKEKEETTLPKEIFNIEVNPDLIYNVVRTQEFAKRQNTAHAKDRSEKRGGGRKPWRQKGTGRARHGSIRSPIWRGGGVTFGPRNERNYKKKINRKAKRKALFMILSAKYENDLLFLVSDLKFDKPKTKKMQTFLENLSIKESVLVVLPEMDKNIILAARNLKNVNTIQAKDINPLSLLSCKYVILSPESVKIIKENFAS